MATDEQQQADDPGTPLEVLADLAYQHAELRAAIAANPSTYPDLLEWLGGLGDPDVDAALRIRAGVLTDEERAADPATDPAVLAELAYQHPELRATISANPNAYDGLRDWIAQAGSAPAPAQVASSTAVGVVSSPGPSRLARLNAKFGPTFTLDTLVLLVVIAVVSVVSLIAGNIVLSAVDNGVTATTVGAISQTGEGPAGAQGSVDGSQSSGGNSDSPGSSDSGGQSEAAVQSAPEPRYVPTVLILDASGSMVRSIPEGGTRMAAARAAAITFVNGLGNNAQMGLTVFGTGTGNEDSDRAAGCFDVTRVIPVGTVDKDRFTSAIAGIVQSGYTPLGPSMKDAAEQLVQYDTAQIVLVTDGVDTCSPPSACEIAAQLHASRPGLTIHTIGFAVDSDEQAQEQLSCIASAGGGEAVDAGNAQQLAARLRAVSDPISTAGAISATGLGDLKLGMSIDQVKAIDDSVELGKVVLDIQYVDCDRATLLFKAGRLYGIQPKKTAPTAEGIRVGDDLATAIGVYGAPVQETDADGTYAQFPATKGSDSGYRVYYEPDTPGALTGKIIRIVLCLCGPGGGTVSEMTNWQIGSDGVGPIKLGMSLSEVFAIVPDPGPGAMATTTSGCYAFQLATSGIGARIGLSLTTSGSGGVVRSIAVSGYDGIAPSRLPKTGSGVGVGSTSAEARSAYPDVTKVWDEGGSYLITTDANGTSLIFEGPNNIDSVQLSTRIEPCV